MNSASSSCATTVQLARTLSAGTFTRIIRVIIDVFLLASVIKLSHFIIMSLQGLLNLLAFCREIGIERVFVESLACLLDDLASLVRP